MTRPLVEFVARRFVEQQGNIAVRSRCRVTQLVESPNRNAVTGVRYDEPNGRSNELAADFIVDASSRGALTLQLLDRVDLLRPQETEIGIDLRYATALFEFHLPRLVTGARCSTGPPPKAAVAGYHSGRE